MRLPILALLIISISFTPFLTRADEIAPPLIHPPSQAPFKPLTPIAPERTAYVAIHFEDYDTSQLSDHDSQTSFQGIRTMMATVRDPSRGGSTRDRVVLVPPHTPKDVRETFQKDGLIVMEMDSTLPHKDICAPKFNRIYLWSKQLAQKYDRVLYLDWDVLVQRPMDHLFLCGEFCMVYNSILHFVDGLMIVKPNPEVFEAMADKYKRDRLTKWSRGGAAHAFESEDKTSVDAAASGAASTAASGSSLYSWSASTSPSKTFCWERSYLFFLEWFGNMEAAELFKPEYGQSPLKLQRLDASAQLNAMMWYEKYSWTLMRGKDYRNMTDPQEVPALSLGFTTLKPFHWGPGLFFNLGWDWSDIRDEYLGLTSTWFVCTRMLLWFALLLFSTKIIKKIMLDIYKHRSGRGLYGLLKSLHLKFLGPTDGWMKQCEGQPVSEGDFVYVPTTVWSISGYWLPLYGSDLLGIIIGSLQALGLMYFMTWYTLLIPILTPPHPAWRIWLMFHTLGIYAINHWIFLSYHACTPLLSTQQKGELLREQGNSPSERSTPTLTAPAATGAISYPLLASTGWLAFWEFALYFMMRRTTIYPEFVVKMFVMFPLIAAILIAAINMNRAVWRSIETSRLIGQGQKETVLPPGIPLLPTSSPR